MSLIQDALKRKTEEQHPLPDAPPPVAPAPPPAPPAAPPIQPAPPKPHREPMTSATQKLLLILVVAVILILLLIGASIYLYLNAPEAPAEAKPAKEAAVITEIKQLTPAPVVTPAPAPSPAPKAKVKPMDKWPELQFSGSAVGGNQILAIINGRMLSVGDSIKGAEVLQIGKSEVLIEFNGERRVLRVDGE